LHWSLYSKYLSKQRAERLHLKFPKYSKLIVMDFAKTDNYDNIAVKY